MKKKAVIVMLFTVLKLTFIVEVVRGYFFGRKCGSQKFFTCFFLFMKKKVANFFFPQILPDLVCGS